MLKELIIEGECNLISERLSLLKPNYLRQHLNKIIDDIRFLNINDDYVDVLLEVCTDYKNKQHEPCDENCNAEFIKGMLKNQKTLD